MKTIKRVQQYVDVVDDIVCNKCGESCRTGDDAFDGLLEVEASGGYWSKIIGDMNRYKFSLCEKCLVEFARTFKIDAFEEGV